MQAKPLIVDRDDFWTVMSDRDDRLFDVTHEIGRLGTIGVNHFAATKDNFEADLHMLGFDPDLIDRVMDDRQADFDIPYLDPLATQPDTHIELTTHDHDDAPWSDQELIHQGWMKGIIS